jgi:hypothetical protein
MILELYNRLRVIAEKEFSEIVEDTEIVFSHTGRARKLRITIIDNTFKNYYNKAFEFTSPAISVPITSYLLLILHPIYLLFEDALETR